jgi:hypothetical protein
MVQTTGYRLQSDDLGWYVTDGVWQSAHYPKGIARLVMQDACWGETGSDGMGTYAQERIA